MKSGKPVVNPFGFTIVEVMVVLAVTIIIFASAVVAVNGRTQKAEFTQAINDTQSTFQSIMNNVATGYYNAQNVYCSTTANPNATLQVSSVSNSNTGQGDCMLLGEAVLFTTGNNYYGFEVLGARQDIGGSGSLSTDYQQAQPTIPPNLPGLVTVNSLSHELVAQWVGYSTTAGGTLKTGSQTNIVAFLDDPNATGTSPAPTGNTASGTIGVNVIPVVVTGTPALGDDSGGTGGALVKATSEVNVSPLNLVNSLAKTADGNTKNPAGGVGVCFASQSTNQSVLYTFGGSNRNTTVENQVFDGATC